MAKERESGARVLEKVVLGKFTLLNNEKVGRVLDLLEGIAEPRDDAERAALGAVGKKDKNSQILALYDRVGGAVKLGDRKIALGTFWDFSAKQPIDKPDFKEEDFEDEYVLVRKQKKTQKEKDADLKNRLKKLDRNEPKGEDSPKEKLDTPKLGKAKKAK